MRGWRRRIFLVLVVYVATLLLWASRPWTDTHALVVPVVPDQEFSASAEYECPSVFGRHAGVRGRQIVSGPVDPARSEETQYPPAGRPCDEQGTHRVLLIVDIAAAGVAMLLLQRSGGRHRASAALEAARVGEVPEASPDRKT